MVPLNLYKEYLQMETFEVQSCTELNILQYRAHSCVIIYQSYEHFKMVRCVGPQ